MADLTALPRHRALAILLECNGDHIWSVEHCRRRGLPEDWIDRFADAHESGFRSDNETIYVDGPASSDGAIQDQHVTNQYYGVHDLSLAMQIGRTFNVDVDSIANQTPGRQRVVEAIKRVIEEG